MDLSFSLDVAESHDEMLVLCNHWQLPATQEELDAVPPQHKSVLENAIDTSSKTALLHGQSATSAIARAVSQLMAIEADGPGSGTAGDVELEEIIRNARLPLLYWLFRHLLFTDALECQFGKFLMLPLPLPDPATAGSESWCCVARLLILIRRSSGFEQVKT